MNRKLKDYWQKSIILKLIKKLKEVAIGTSNN